MIRGMTDLASSPESGSQPTVLLTLGRLPVALDLARGFKELGWRVVVAEPIGMHLCRMSAAVDRCHRVQPPVDSVEPYVDAITRVVCDEAADLVVPVSEEIVAVSLLRDRLPAGVRLFCSDHSHVLRLHDKLAFNRMAAEMGLPVPRTWSQPMEFRTFRTRSRW